VLLHAPLAHPWQVLANLWVRNGSDVFASVQLFFMGQEVLLEPDMLLLQCWLAAAAAAGAAGDSAGSAAAAELPARGSGGGADGSGVPGVLSALLGALAGSPLLQAAGLECAARSGSRGAQRAAPSAADLVSALSDATTRLGLDAGLRLLVMLLRDRTLGVRLGGGARPCVWLLPVFAAVRDTPRLSRADTPMPPPPPPTRPLVVTAGQGSRDRCRTQLLHLLAVQDCSYTSLMERLPSALHVCVCVCVCVHACAVDLCVG
jgi:hypothetical protein